MVARAASVIWERCVTSEAVRRHREETQQLTFSFESKVLLRVNIYAFELSAQGMGALNTSLSLEAELGPLGRNGVVVFFLKHK